MAKGVINLQKESGGVTKITSTDGIGITELVLPESGNLVSVNTAVTDNALARYDGTTGKLQNSGVIVDDSGNVGIGVIPSAWSTSKALQLGAYSSIHENSSTGACYIGSNFYRSGTSTTNYISSSWGAAMYEQNGGNHHWYTAPAGTAGNTIPWTNIMTLDASGNLTLNSGTGALGYGAGAGGVVTQLTSKSTSVTLNKPCGRIIMNNSALANGAVVGFAFNNNLLSANDKVEVEAVFSGVTYNTYVYYSTTGTAYIAVENKSGTDRADVIDIKFFILKGATS